MNMNQRPRRKDKNYGKERERKRILRERGEGGRKDRLWYATGGEKICLASLYILSLFLFAL